MLCLRLMLCLCLMLCVCVCVSVFHGSQETGEHVDALMSCLSRMPGLEEVSIEVTLLDESWATGFLQLFLACPHLKHIT